MPAKPDTRGTVPPGAGSEKTNSLQADLSLATHLLTNSFKVSTESLFDIR